MAQSTILALFLGLLILNTQARLLIQSPPELKKSLEGMYPDGIHYSVANYGDVPFGRSLGGNIYLGNYLENCQYEPLSEEAQRNINKVVLSTRGDCTFTTKSLNSQKQGAKLAIIADNQWYEDPGSIIMADDGKGPQVRIPTIMINHEVGQLIIDYITNKKQNVTIYVDFETIKRDKADVTLWINSYDRKSYILVRQLEPYLSRIQNYVNLAVYHPTSACSTCPETDCFNKNKFCINTGFFGFYNVGYGRELIRQQLREELIMQKFPKLWWKYMEEFDDQCDEPEVLADCSSDAMQAVGINPKSINDEVQSLFETSQENGLVTSKRLEENDQLRYKSGLLIFPGIIVNNITYRGNLDALEVFELVCESLSTEPPECNLEVSVKTESPLKYIIISVVIFVLFMVFLLLCYRRMVRRELSKNINNEVNQLVNQYITMYESQRFEGAELGPTTK